MGSLLLIGTLIIFIIAFKFYGGHLTKKVQLNNNNITPAHELRDNVDYVPAKMPVLVGHHFASIAGAAPIIGPVTAIVYGWVPALAWIVIGGVFLGGVHDFISLVSSVRNKGVSIGTIIENEVGKLGKILFLVFTWLTLVLVVAVFTFVVAKTFNTSPSTSTASISFIFLAMIFGVLLFKNILSFKFATILGILGIIFAIFFSLKFSYILSLNSWVYLILVYIFFASILPVWLLLQPRDYLSSFLLYAILIIGVLSIIFYNPTIKFDSFTAFNVKSLGYMFPFLFVTIACGAISGFHSIVSSGTSSKQLDKEKDALPVGYGSMLIESLLAVIALITAGFLSKGEYFELLKAKGPMEVFANGISTFGAVLHIPKDFLTTFALLAISAFALTSLDTATRLARFSWQELFNSKNNKIFQFLANKYVATIVTIAAGGYLALSGFWKQIWPLFGAANQLLAALALLSGYLWFKSHHKGGVYFIFIPMIFMYSVTLTALGFLIKNNLVGEHVSYVRAVIASLLFVLAIVLLIISIKKILRKN